MPRYASHTLLWLLVAALCGCQHLTLRDPDYASAESPHRPRPTSEGRQQSVPTAAKPSAVTSVVETDTAPNEPPQQQAPSQSKELAEILAAIEEVGETDPELQRELMASVRQMMQQADDDPLLWSRMQGTILAAISYRKSKQQDAAKAESVATQAPEPSQTPAAVVAPVSYEAPLPTATPSVELAQPGSMSTNTTESESPGSPAHSLDLHQILTPPAQQSAEDQPDLAAQLTKLRQGPWGFGESGRALSVGDADSPLTSALASDWKSHLEQAIAQLETQTGSAPQTSEEINRHAALKMLHLLAGNREQAVAPINGISPELQDFWSNQLYGLAMVQDTETITDPARRATEAATHLRYANQRLGEAGVLEIRNLAFCKSAQGFGLYEPFTPRNFTAGQQVVLYLEIENFRTAPSKEGHSLSLAGKYRILDNRGKALFQGELGKYEEQCRSRRRDLYYSNLIALPGSLPGGDYVMQVTVEDKIGRKMADATINFSIASSTP